MGRFKETNSVKEIEDWANMIESRDDLEFESEEGKLLIEKLANPELYGSTEKILKENF